MEALAGPAPDAEPACGIAWSRLFQLRRAGPVAGQSGADGFGAAALATTVRSSHQPADHGGPSERNSQLVAAASAAGRSG